LIAPVNTARKIDLSAHPVSLRGRPLDNCMPGEHLLRYLVLVLVLSNFIYIIIDKREKTPVQNPDPKSRIMPLDRERER